METTKPTGIRVELREGAETEFGTLTPAAVLTFADGLSYRLCAGYMHRLAAVVEELSLADQWIVNISGVGYLGTGRGSQATLSLELGLGTQDEANRGIMVLGLAIKQIRAVK